VTAVGFEAYWVVSSTCSRKLDSLQTKELQVVFSQEDLFYLAIFRLVNGKIQTQFEKTVVNLATIASSCIFWDQICALEISALNSSLLG
jgi:hypothetical protein